MNQPKDLRGWELFLEGLASNDAEKIEQGLMGMAQSHRTKAKDLT